MKRSQSPAVLGDGRFASMAGALVLAVLLVGIGPIIAREGTQDWLAYAQAGDRLRAGAQLYDFELETEADEYFLYPPLMAAAWVAVGSPEGLIALKLFALLGVGALASLIEPPGGRRWIVAIGLTIASLAWPPILYDIVLGNVMVLYAGAIAWSLARRGWLAAAPLGLVLALAAKPAVGPFVLWLLLRRPADGLRVFAVAVVASIATAVAIGPHRYLEYITALPSMTVLATPFSGNVGLVTVSVEAAVAGLVVAYLAAVVAGLRLDERHGAAVAIAAMLLAQGTIGFNYASVLLPALIVLWSVDHVVGLGTFLVTALLMIVSPVGAAVATMAAGLGSGLRRART